MTGSSDAPAGYGKPPVSGRFQKGQSGNPKGRPRGRKTGAPYEAVLGQLVTVREDGVEHQITASEAFLLHLTKKALEGDTGAATLAMPVLEDARARRDAHTRHSNIRIVIKGMSPGSVNAALEPLRMARKLDSLRDTARMVLEPWIVEMALERLGAQHLSPDKQRVVLAATRTPKRVKWPDWWTELPE